MICRDSVNHAEASRRRVRILARVAYLGPSRVSWPESRAAAPGREPRRDAAAQSRPARVACGAGAGARRVDSDGSCCSCSIGRGLRLLEYRPRQEAGSGLDLGLGVGLGPLQRRIDQ